jgi:hypothetical protein
MMAALCTGAAADMIKKQVSRPSYQVPLPCCCCHCAASAMLLLSCSAMLLLSLCCFCHAAAMMSWHAVSHQVMVAVPAACCCCTLWRPWPPRCTGGHSNDTWSMTPRLLDECSRQ